jgi:ankyrin repeat protein
MTRKECLAAIESIPAVMNFIISFEYKYIAGKFPHLDQCQRLNSRFSAITAMTSDADLEKLREDYWALMSSGVIITNIDDTPLKIAIEQGNLEMVRLLIKAKADIFVLDFSGNSLLTVAAKKGHIDIMKLLISSGIDVNVAGRSGRTPLHGASEYQDSKGVDSLLKLGAQVNAVDCCGDTPLHNAAESGSVDSVNLLLKAGALLDPQDWEGYTPLMRCIRVNAIEPLKLLISRGADINRLNAQGDSALDLATCYGHGELIRTLIENGAKINDQVLNETERYITYYKGIEEPLSALNAYQCHRLLEKPLDSKTQSYDCEFIKDWEKINKIMKSLEVLQTHLEFLHDISKSSGESFGNYFDEDKYNKDPLFGAGMMVLSDQRINILHSRFMNLMQDPSAEKLQTLHDDLSNLIKSDDLRDRLGNSPLHMYALWCFSDRITELSERGVNINSVNRLGQTPLFLAACNNRSYLERAGVKFNTLLKAGADPNIADNHGRTPLNYLMQYHYCDSKEKIIKLIEAKADVNQCDQKGISPFRVAIQYGQSEIVELFIRQGGIVQATALERQKLLALAKKKGDDAIVSAIQESIKNQSSAETSSSLCFGWSMKRRKNQITPLPSTGPQNIANLRIERPAKSY